LFLSPYLDPGLVSTLLLQIPWSLRDLIAGAVYPHPPNKIYTRRVPDFASFFWKIKKIVADERVIHFFSREITELRDAFREWNPKTAILRDIKRKLQPIQRLPATLEPASKL
jgi:hypothetical protein